MVLAKPRTREEGRDLLPGPLFAHFSASASQHFSKIKAEMLNPAEMLAMGLDPIANRSSVFVLRSPELAVETLDQALAVLVGLLVVPEMLDLLVAQTI